MQSERLRQEHGHLSARERLIRTEVAAAAPRRDPRACQCFDELEERVARRDIVECRDRRWRADLEAVPDGDVVEALEVHLIGRVRRKIQHVDETLVVDLVRRG